MGILPHRYTCAFPLVFLETTDTLLSKQITTTSLLPGWKFVLAFSCNLSSVPEISNETLNQAFQTTIFLMSSTQISDSIFTSNAAFAKTFRNFWKELHREGNDWAYIWELLYGFQMGKHMCAYLLCFGKFLLSFLSKLQGDLPVLKLWGPYLVENQQPSCSCLSGKRLHSKDTIKSRANRGTAAAWRDTSRSEWPACPLKTPGIEKNILISLAVMSYSYFSFQHGS